MAQYHLTSHLWPNPKDAYFRDSELTAQLQDSFRCVSTSLAILTNQNPETFAGHINTQDPYSWSQALKPWNMKLAYCPTDVRKLQYYMDELIALDDLFTLSYYIAYDPGIILDDPDEDGWVTSSHIVVLHRDRILDPATGTSVAAGKHHCNECHTKRIFRVIPSDHPRGL
ncbi:MAG: hypothetical protein ACR2HF_16020 [Methylococcaceae bacterium]